jgi:DNA adenine methylase
MNDIKITKPFLKWVGGKTQIIKNILEYFPSEIKNYYEPFLGGGSVLLGLLSLSENGLIKIKGKINVYDTNETLISIFKDVRDNKEELFNKVMEYLKKYNSCKGKTVNKNPKNSKEALTSKESYYYWLRKKFNITKKQCLKKSALFLIINKTCFRGIYREGPNGFNVPYGHYKQTPEVINKKYLNYISYLIRNVNFICDDFENVLKKIKRNDFVYLDPPYAPLKKTSFVGYNKNGFHLDRHKKLFDLIIKLDKSKVKFVMSNAKVDLVNDYFKDFKIIDIVCRRAINSKKPNEKTSEVIIHNFNE